jgi:hypothetical protein
MSEEPAKDAARPRLIRCPDGHVFDASAAACPICGAAATTAAPDPPPARVDPAPRPGKALFAFAVGAALLLLLTVFVVFRGAPPDVERTPPPVIEAARAPGDAIDVPAEKSAPPPADNVETVAAPAAKVERWRTMMVIAGRSYECVNETTPDGRYRLGAGCPPPFAGETGLTIVNADGSWSSRSDAGRTDAGTIEALDADRFIAHTKGGPILWERVK